MRSQWVALICSTLSVSVSARAQTSYYNLDAGRPLRIEDATPTAFNDLGLQLAPFRVERYVDGLMRYRVEPKLSYGILPLTELEIRMPVLTVVPRDSGSRPVTGIASLGIGASHALTMEGTAVPAIAIAGEWLAPVGRFAAPRSSVGFEALLTKTFVAGRIHMNVGAGTYSVQPTAAVASPGSTNANSGCVQAPRFQYVAPPIGTVYCPDTTGGIIHIVPDLPCERAQPAPIAQSPASTDFLCDGGSQTSGTATSSTSSSPAVTSPSISHGRHTIVGIGLDHAFPLASTLVVASVTSERFEGLYPTADLTVEFGARHQLSPRLVADAAISRRLRGSAQFTALTAGATYSFARPFHFRERP